MANDGGSLGKASLWISIAGLIVPVCLAILLAIWVLAFVPQSRLGPSYENSVLILAGAALCIVLFVVLELIALGFGIAARRTERGKVGLEISGGLLTLAVAAVAFALYRSDYFRF